MTIVRKHITTNLANLYKRPALKKFVMSTTIRRFTTDANGTIINDALVPAAQQKAFPFHLFGEFDRQSGYAISDSILRELGDTILFSVYTVGLGTPLFFFSPLNTINSKLSKGDLVFLYVDDFNAPSYFHFVVVSTTLGGYASLTSLANVTQLDNENKWGAFYFENFKFSWSNDSQFALPLFNIQTSYKSSYQANPINLESYRFIEQKPGVNTLTIPVALLMNQYNGLSGYIAWNNPLLTFSFNLIY